MDQSIGTCVLDWMEWNRPHLSRRSQLPPPCGGGIGIEMGMGIPAPASFAPLFELPPVLLLQLVALASSRPSPLLQTCTQTLLSLSLPSVCGVPWPPPAPLQRARSTPLLPFMVTIYFFLALTFLLEYSF
jgi:hypothetical protein